MSASSQRTKTFCNLHLLNFEEELDGGMPLIKPYNGVIPENFVSFNQRSWIEPPENMGVHFYIDDYQFERVWRAPERYTTRIKAFQMTIAPDYSVFLDAPKAVNLWNIYRSKLLAAHFQARGVAIVPNLSVCTGSGLVEESLAGVPEKSIIAINAMGVRDYHSRRIWRHYAHTAIDRLRPSYLLVYGTRLALVTSTPIHYIENHTLERLRR